MAESHFLLLYLLCSLFGEFKLIDLSPSWCVSTLCQPGVIVSLFCILLTVYQCHGACAEVDSDTEAVAGKGFKLGCISCKRRSEVDGAATVQWYFRPKGEADFVHVSGFFFFKSAQNVTDAARRRVLEGFVLPEDIVVAQASFESNLSSAAFLQTQSIYISIYIALPSSVPSFVSLSHTLTPSIGWYLPVWRSLWGSRRIDCDILHQLEILEAPERTHSCVDFLLLYIQVKIAAKENTTWDFSTDTKKLLSRIATRLRTEVRLRLKYRWLSRSPLWPLSISPHFLRLCPRELPPAQIVVTLNRGLPCVSKRCTKNSIVCNHFIPFYGVAGLFAGANPSCFWARVLWHAAQLSPELGFGTSNLPITSRPALPAELQPPLFQKPFK